MKPESLETIFALSSMQQGVLFHTLVASESSVYLNQSVFTIEGDLDIHSFERAWQHVMDRHQALRCSFFWDGIRKPVQVVHRRVALNVAKLDWRDLPPEQCGASLERLMDADRRRGFDLRRPPQMRLTLIRTDEHRHELLWTRHHILFDGWSQGLLLGEVFRFYEVFHQGWAVACDKDLARAGPPLEDYIRWLQQNAPHGADAFWHDYLAGLEKPVDLSSESPTCGTKTSIQCETTVHIEPHLGAELREVCRLSHITISILLQAAWSLILASASGRNDIVFGLTVSGRPADLAGIDQMVGLFINTLPVRAIVHPGLPFIEFARKLQRQQSQLTERQHTSLVEIQGASQIRPPKQLFGSIVVIGNYPTEFYELRGQSSLQVCTVRNRVQNSLPLTLRVMPSQGSRISLLYDPDRFHESNVRSLLDRLKQVLEIVGWKIERPLGEVLHELERVYFRDTRSALKASHQRLAELRSQGRSRR
jgi:hypothetical protein